jgi:hypothetical protein
MSEIEEIFYKIFNNLNKREKDRIYRCIISRRYKGLKEYLKALSSMYEDKIIVSKGEEYNGFIISSNDVFYLGKDYCIRISNINANYIKSMINTQGQDVFLFLLYTQILNLGSGVLEGDIKISKNCMKSQQ